MKANLFLFLAVMLLASACRKDTRDAPTVPPPVVLDSLAVAHLLDTAHSSSAVPYPQHGVGGCFPKPLYGDSIVYPQPKSGSDEIMQPVNDPGPGHYLSWPGGLVIDSMTGAINLTRSQGGERYAIGYVKKGTKDTCLSLLVIGGAAYADSVYVIGSSSSIAYPYFNSNINTGSDCSGSGNSGHCSFTLTGSGGSQYVMIDKHSGDIDLMETLNGSHGHFGAFGLFPINGSSITATITYSLKKGSNSAPQKIDVQFIYYDNLAAIDPGVLALVHSRLNNILDVTLISVSASPRPPLVIIVRR